MKRHLSRLALSATAVAVLAITGCGGGGGTPTPGAEGPTIVTPAAVTLTGTAAKGAPFDGAVIAVFDSTGARVDSAPATVAADGTFSVTLNAGAKAPFVLVATRTSDSGDTETLVSVAESASVAQVNVTPITTLIASRLSDSGDPAKLATELQDPNRAPITAADIQATVAEVQAILQPLLEATGTGATDPLTGSFATDGTGYDRLLDSLNISIVPSSATEANIEIAIKSTDPAAQTPLTFTSSAPTVTPVASVSPGSLVAPGTSVQIADFLSRLTACYALPTADRVSGSNVTSPACQSVFFDSDPSGYRHNGGTVGPNGAFATLFSATAVGVQFSQGTYEFTRGTGDIVAGYKVTDPQGNVRYDSVVLRSDAGGTQLNLIGNQYVHPGKVTAFHQKRQFITLGQGAYDYLSTGYSIDVTNRTTVVGTSTVPLYNRVVVTTPKGKRLVLRPQTGSANLVFYRGDDPDSISAPTFNTGTNFVRLRSQYLDGSSTRAHPSSFDANLVFVRNDQGDQEDYREDELATIPNQSVWTIEYFMANNPTVKAATQTYRTRARAMTIGELQAQGMASLSAAALAQVQSLAQPANVKYAGQLLADDESSFDIALDGGDAWTVPAGTVAPTSIVLYGKGSTNFNDSVAVKSSDRSAVVPCSAQGSADTHCSTTTPGAFAAGVRFDGLQLLSTDAAGRTFGSFHAMYQVNTAQ